LTVMRITTTQWEQYMAWCLAVGPIFSRVIVRTRVAAR
jgi:hypothetical protein